MNWAKRMFKKHSLTVLFLLTNIALYALAYWSDHKHGTSAGWVLKDANAVVAMATQMLTILLVLVVGPSLVFQIAARNSETNATSISIFVAINCFSATFCAYQYLTQTDSSRVFFFAIHWAVSWVLAIIAAATVRPPHRAKT